MIYRFDTFSLDTEKFVIFNGSDKLSLEPRVFDLMLYLIENRDRLVSKDELIESLWGGRVITDSALNTCIRSVRRALDDNRERQNFIRTFPKRGFQFVGKIQGDQPSNNDSDSNPQITPGPQGRFLAIGGFIILLIVALLGVFMNLNTNNDLETFPSDKASIAILNFDGSFANDNQRFFTEGLVEELTASLALGAEYIVDGSVKYDDDQMRISVRLVNTRSGQQVWSTQFNRDQSEIYTLQSELAYLIAGQIVPELIRADTVNNSKKPPEVLDAWALYHKARSKQAVYSEEMQNEAIHWAQLALERDPNLAAAHGVIARAKGTQFFYRWTANPEQTLEEAIFSA
jgi:DNA-binding winged helix-turn-helix (wHTH) protein/TolB-like protein